MPTDNNVVASCGALQPLPCLWKAYAGLEKIKKKNELKIRRDLICL